MTSRVILLSTAGALCLLVGHPSTADAARAGCRAALQACIAAERFEYRVCERDCTRRPDAADVRTCRQACRAERDAEAAHCRSVEDPCAVACDAPAGTCAGEIRACRKDARRAYRPCRRACRGRLALRCRMACDRERAATEAACGYVAAGVALGAGITPDLPLGEPADLSLLLDSAEHAIIDAADQRAETLRRRPLRLWVGQPGAEVTVTQTRHAFTIGFPMDFREFADRPDDLAFYGEIARAHTNLMVAETALKWRNAQPHADTFSFDLADTELAWAADNGFPVKAHTLLWGNAPPLSSGSGTPEWLRNRFPDADLTPAEQEELRGLIRTYVEAVVSRYAGRIDIWDVTNETLNLFTPWFMDRLGLDVVHEIFHQVRALDPGAQLVFNEWITEVFTGFRTPSAAEVRDRVRQLLAAGVPIDAVGQQAHFVPGVVWAGLPADLSKRTRIDDYAAALDTLAEAGLPIHITETNFVAPDEPELRAAQAEALMRVWWGHPAVEQVVFWGLWNEVAARNHLNFGLWTNDGDLSRHGAAVVSLLNDRWRTRATLTADANGVVELQATLGEYVATWDVDGTPVHAAFSLRSGPGPATVALVRE